MGLDFNLSAKTVNVLKRLVLTSCFLLSIMVLKSQGHLVDSSRYYFKEAKQILDTNVLVAKEVMYKSFRFALESKNDSVIASSAGGCSIIYNILNLDDSSLYFSKISVAALEKTKNYDKLNVVLTLIANAYSDIGQFDSASIYYDKNEAILHKIKDAKAYFFYKMNKAIFYKQLSMFDYALNELVEAEQAMDSLKSYDFKGNILSGIASIYREQKRYKEAVNTSLESLKYFDNHPTDMSKALVITGHSYGDLKKFDSAYHYLKQSRVIVESIKGGYANVAASLLTECELLIDQDLQDQAYQQLRKIDSSQISLKQNIERLTLLAKVAPTVKQSNQYLEKALRLTDEYKGLIYQNEILTQLVDNYKSTSQYKKLSEYQSRLIDIRDSLNKKTNDINLQRLFVERAIIQKEQELALAKKQHLVVSASRRTQFWIFTTGILLLVFILSILYFSYRLIKKRKELVQLQNKQLRNENVEVKKDLTQLSFKLDQGNELLSQAKKVLKDTKTQNQPSKEINDLLLLTNQFIQSEEEKKIFSEKLEGIHQSFFQKLDEQGKLTKTEKKIASFVLVGMSSKEISTIQKVEESTIEVYRSRIRKKMKVSKDQSLFDYLSKL